jgi:hypothetical protein
MCPISIVEVGQNAEDTMKEVYSVVTRLQIAPKVF